MDNFNLKQYLFESRVGMYSKAVLNESALLDAETLAREIAKQHPELIRFHHDGEGRKLQDAIFTYAGEMLQGAGIPLQTVRGLAYDTAWALDLVNGVKDALERGELKETSSSSIKTLRDLYYFDKLSLLAAKEDVDPKYYKYGTLWISKGDVIDSNQEEYDMIIDSGRLKKGIDYIDSNLKEVNPAALGAPQAAADAKMQQQDDQNGDMVDNVSMGLEEENPMEAAYGNIGSVDKVKPAETGISKYLDILNAHDWFYHFSDDHRTWQRGQADKDNLKALYSTLTPNEKQQAMDTFVDKYLQVYKPDQFPAAANNVKYLTTDTFKGAI
jgi:hypothetical protein